MKRTKESIILEILSKLQDASEEEVIYTNGLITGLQSNIAKLMANK